MRFRVTVRDKNIELRGYVDGVDALHHLVVQLDPVRVIASVAEDDYSPWRES